MMNRKHSSRGWSSMEPQNSYRIESTKMSVNTSKKPPFATQRPKLPVSAIELVSLVWRLILLKNEVARRVPATFSCTNPFRGS